jgi:hypothetical protein
MAAALWAALPLSRVEAQETPGAEIRLAARDFGNGSVSVGLQHRQAGAWRSVTPTRHILPASARFDHWYTTAAAEIEVVQASVEIGLRNRAWTAVDGPDQFTLTIGGTRYAARCGRLNLQLLEDGLELRTGSSNCDEVIVVEPSELAAPTDVGMQVVRVAARRLSTGGIELGIQRLVGGQWEALRQPIRPVLTGLSRSTGRFTSSLQLPTLPAHVFGDLRRGVSITTRDSEFDLEVDGRVYRSRCGVLELGILTEHILVDTATEDCHGSAPLLTICPTSDCDAQQNAAYAWEARQVGASLDQIEVTRSEAQAVVDAIFSDFFPRSRAPTVSFSSEQSHGHAGGREIVLGTSVRNLGAVVHELAHSLVDRANVRDVGHGGAFTAMLLYLWERYFPIADVQAARDDAERHGIEVASRPPIQTRFSEARQAIGELFCDRTDTSPELCAAATGAMTQLPDAVFSGRYVGSGRLPNGWYSAGERAGVGFRSFLAVESNELTTGASRARLSIECNTDDELEVDVWWRQAEELPPVLQYRFGDAEWIEDRWYTISGGTWGDDSWALHRAPDARTFLQAALWQTRNGEPFTVRYVLDGRVFTASFGIDDMFDTPVQPNLVQCGESDIAAVSDDPVIDWGRFGDNLFWGVDEDELPLTSYVAMDAPIAQTGTTARLSLQCEMGQLEVDLYWEVGQDLDWTVRYRIDDGAIQTEEWRSGWGTWGDREYKWTGREDAGDLISQMAWAAQTGGSFTVEAYARNDPNRRFTATFDLDGLFETPVQPNLARCGR